MSTTSPKPKTNIVKVSLIVADNDYDFVCEMAERNGDTPRDYLIALLFKAIYLERYLEMYVYRRKRTKSARQSAAPKPESQ